VPLNDECPEKAESSVMTRSSANARLPESAPFWLDLGSGPVEVRKLAPGEFGDAHREAVLAMRLDSDRLVSGPGWVTGFLGAGEEKAVHVVQDPDGRVFALEVIDERGYLRGRLADGHYFADLRVPGLIQAADAASFARRATGLVRAREYVHGWEWARFRLDARRGTWLDGMVTGWLQMALMTPMREYRSRFGDVHERNVMFELRPRGAPGVPVPGRDPRGRLRLFRIGLRPIDVR
jgi:hypothetical protein